MRLRFLLCRLHIPQHLLILRDLVHIFRFHLLNLLIHLRLKCLEHLIDLCLMCLESYIPPYWYALSYPQSVWDSPHSESTIQFRTHTKAYNWIVYKSLHCFSITITLIELSFKHGPRIIHGVYRILDYNRPRVFNLILLLHVYGEMVVLLLHLLPSSLLTITLDRHTIYMKYLADIILRS